VIDSRLVKITGNFILQVATEDKSDFDGKPHMSNAKFTQAGYDWTPKEQWRGIVLCPSVVEMAPALDQRFDVQVIVPGDCGYRIRGKTDS
jgi:hypothetical protein